MIITQTDEEEATHGYIKYEFGLIAQIIEELPKEHISYEALNNAVNTILNHNALVSAGHQLINDCVIGKISEELNCFGINQKVIEAKATTILIINEFCQYIEDQEYSIPKVCRNLSYLDPLSENIALKISGIQVDFSTHNNSIILDYYTNHHF